MAAPPQKAKTVPPNKTKAAPAIAKEADNKNEDEEPRRLIFVE
jgi:hypothetical protein